MFEEPSIEESDDDTVRPLQTQGEKQASIEEIQDTPLNIYIYTLGLDHYPGIITHPGSLVPSLRHYTILAIPGQDG